MGVGFGGAFYGVNVMKLTSQAFKEGQPIPQVYTCQGKNVSFPLTISDAPKETKSFAIVMDDPDAPGGTFDHWIAWNIPAKKTTLEEGVSLAHVGKNHMKKEGYFGPCPPAGAAHHYHIRVYALDTEFDLENGISKEELHKAMDGHILSQAELIGTYKRS